MTTGKKLPVEPICGFCRHIKHVVEEVSSICCEKGEGGSPKDEPHIKGKGVIEELLHHS